MESITISVDSKWASIVRSPAYYVVAALTGVSVTFLPMFLYGFGRDGVADTDWRVISCWLTTVLVTVVHFRLSAPVISALRAGRPAPDPPQRNERETV